MKRLLALALLAPSLALAQTQQPKGKYAPVTKVVFGEDGVIEAGSNRPLEEMVDSPARSQHGSIIKLRENFSREVLKETP